MQNQIFCPNCHSQYKDDNLPRILTMCGHTFCEACIANMIRKNDQSQNAQTEINYTIKCPEDGAVIELALKQINVFPKNIALIKVLQSKKNCLQFKDQSFNVSKIGKQQSIPSDDLTDELIIEMTQTKDIFQPDLISSSKNSEQLYEDLGDSQKSYFEKESTESHEEKDKNIKQQDDVCLLHQKPLQIVCLNDKQKICSKCALFGEHKGHLFKGIQQVQQQTTICYTNILKIFQQKQNLDKLFSEQRRKIQYTDRLIKRKKTLQKQIKDEFKKCYDQIFKQEKKILKKLDQTFKQAQAKVSFLKIEDKCIQDFKNWQKQSYQLIKILENNELKQKINIFYSKDQMNMKLVNAGILIINEIKNEQQKLNEKVNQLVINIQLKKNKKIYEYLKDFVQIVNEPEKSIQIKPIILQIKSKFKITSPKRSLKSSIEVLDESIFDNLRNQIELQRGQSFFQESLLDVQQTQSILPSSTQQFQQSIINFNQNSTIRKPLNPIKFLSNNQHQDSICCNFTNLSLSINQEEQKIKKFQRIFNNDENKFESARKSMIMTSRPSITNKNCISDKPTKKKLKGIKVPQKYQKILEGIYDNTLDTIDLTNGQFGDQIMLQICEFIKYSKARSIKLIRNKISDNGLQKILPSLSNAQILNLSQNVLTQNTIDLIIKNRYGCLANLKNLILSQNKIIQRKHKLKIDQLRAMGLTVSV